MIQPVLMARFSKKRDYAELNRRANLIYKLNCFILAPILIWLALMGDSLTTLLSSGKYPNTGWILLALLVLLIVQGHNAILEYQGNAAEKSSILFYSSLIPGFFLLPAIFLVQWLGVAGLILSRLFGMLARDIFLVWVMRKQGMTYFLDRSGLLRLCSCVIIPIILLIPIIPENGTWLSSSVIGIVSILLFFLAAFLFKPFSVTERQIINSLLGRKVFVW